MILEEYQTNFCLLKWSSNARTRNIVTFAQTFLKGTKLFCAIMFCFNNTFVPNSIDIHQPQQIESTLSSIRDKCVLELLYLPLHTLTAKLCVFQGFVLRLTKYFGFHSLSMLHLEIFNAIVICLSENKYENISYTVPLADEIILMSRFNNALSL